MTKLKWYWFIPIIGIVFMQKINTYSLDRFQENEHSLTIWTAIHIVSLVMFLLWATTKFQ